MTDFEHTKEHELECECSYCWGVDPNKSIARELERHVEELIKFSFLNLNEEQQKFVCNQCDKILLLRRYFPKMELPPKHQRLRAEIEKD